MAACISGMTFLELVWLTVMYNIYFIFVCQLMFK